VIIGNLIPVATSARSDDSGAERIVLYTASVNDTPSDFSFLNNSAVSENCTLLFRSPELQFLVAEVPANESVYYTNELLKLPGVNTAEPDILRYPESLDQESSSESSIRDQWAFERVMLSSVLPSPHSLTGNQTITVAILDTGIDLSHQHLSGSVRSDGFDWIENSPSISDPDGHGTFLAGLINSFISSGGSGAGNVSLLPERVGTQKQGIYGSLSALAIRDAADKGAQIILMGYGGKDQSPAEEAAIAYAAQKGCILIAPAGNDASNEGHYPSDYSEVISVGSTGKTDGLSYFSNYGIFVELVSPGEGILSLWPGNTTQTATGTSLSAAQVAGCAALVLQTDPSLSRSDVREILTSTAHDLGRNGRDIYYGYGLLNAAAAVNKTRELRDKGIERSVRGSVNLSHDPESENGGHSSVVRSGGNPMTAIDLPLNTGWNFVTLPAFPASGKRSQDLFRTVNTDGHTIWVYDGDEQDWRAIEKESDLYPLEGLLLYSDRVTSIPLVFNSSSVSYSRELNTGWNLIGTPGLVPITAKEGLATISDTWVSLLQFNSSVQGYDPAVIQGAEGVHADSRLLAPFSAFWVYMNGPGTYSPMGTGNQSNGNN
jgi:hypothetical protein